MTHIESWLWLIGVCLFFFGVAAGFTLSRYNDARWKRGQQLEKELLALTKEYHLYRSEVNRHFTTSAHLINNLNQTYNHVIDHIAYDSQRLCTEQNFKSLGFDSQYVSNEDNESDGMNNTLNQCSTDDLPKHSAKSATKQQDENNAKQKVKAKQNPEQTQTKENKKLPLDNVGAANDEKTQAQLRAPLKTNPSNKKITLLDSKEKPAKKARETQRRVVKKKSPSTVAATKRVSRNKLDTKVIAAENSQEHVQADAKKPKLAKMDKHQAEEKTEQEWFPQDGGQVTV